MPLSQDPHRQVLGSGGGSLSRSGRLFDAARQVFEPNCHSLKRCIGISWSHRKSRQKTPPPLVHVRLQWCGACSRRTRGPTGRSTARPSAAAWTAATARWPPGWRTGPSSARPPWTRWRRSSPAGRSNGSTRPSARRSGSASTSSPSWTACPRTRSSATPSSWSSASHRAAASWSTPCCAAPRRWPPAGSRGCPRPRRRRPRCATPTRSGSPRCGSARSGPTRPAR